MKLNFGDCRADALCMIMNSSKNKKMMQVPKLNRLRFRKGQSTTLTRFIITTNLDCDTLTTRFWKKVLLISLRNPSIYVAFLWVTSNKMLEGGTIPGIRRESGVMGGTMSFKTLKRTCTSAC